MSITKEKFVELFSEKFFKVNPDNFGGIHVKNNVFCNENGEIIYHGVEVSYELYCEALSFCEASYDATLSSYYKKNKVYDYVTLNTHEHGIKEKESMPMETQYVSSAYDGIIDSHAYIMSSLDISLLTIANNKQIEIFTGVPTYNCTNHHGSALLNRHLGGGIQETVDQDLTNTKETAAEEKINPDLLNKRLQDW